MALDYPGLLADLDQESNWLRDAVSPLSSRDWQLPTPAAGWSIKDQILHLTYFDQTTALAMADPDRFASAAAALIEMGPDFPGMVAERMRPTPPGQALIDFQNARSALQHQLSAMDPSSRMPWYGPDMSIASCATARLMETWAHGQDVYDALGLAHPIGRGLRSIAHLGVRTFGFAHTLRGLAKPAVEVRIELSAPDDSGLWTWGPPDAPNSVTGSAQDFVLVVTQRRHVRQTSLRTSGAVATRWMEIAQVYAGAPGMGRSPQGAG